MTSVGIIGASGFTGAELLRLCAQHPHLDVRVATGDTQAGSRVADLYPSLAAAYARPGVREVRPRRRATASTSCSSACPTAPRRTSCPSCGGRVGRIVDLAADFRLRDPALYPRWYGEEHAHPELLGDVRLRAARAVPRPTSSAPPGWRPPAATSTTAVLALAPLLRAGLVEPTGIVVDAASGVSGAGRPPKPTTDVLHGRRGLHRLRPARPPAHPRDRAGPEPTSPAPTCRCCSRPTWRR